MMTDQQLQLALAKLLPEKIAEHAIGKLYWIESNNGFILDTEWLHVCWLIEQGLSEQEQNHYTTRLIFDRIGPDNTNLVVWEALTASWQQRAEALCKVKGIAI